MTAMGGLLFGLYRMATMLFRPLSGLYLRRRLRQGKEDAGRLGERRGRTDAPRPPGPLVWVHGASVGEGVALLPLIDQLIARGFGVIVTTGTLTSARILAQRLPPGAFHQFAPLDVPLYVRRFLEHWRPRLVLLAESELWPNLLVEVSRRAIPLVLVNARMSQRSFERWRRAPRLIELLLGRTALCLAQTTRDGERLAALGARHVTVPGNLKFDGPAPPADPADVRSLRNRIGARPAWVAASTHADEEAIVLDVDRKLRSRFPDLLTIIAPRQPGRGEALAQAAADRSMPTRLRSRDEPPDAATHLYIADTMGELGLLYRVTRLVFVGKSLAGLGGQNPIEPAKLGGAILHGRGVANFADVYGMLGEGGGALAVDDATALADALARLLGDDAACATMGEAARETVARQAGATARIMATIEPLLAHAAETARTG